jgi:hypothetical protein
MAFAPGVPHTYQRYAHIILLIQKTSPYSMSSEIIQGDATLVQAGCDAYAKLGTSDSCAMVLYFQSALSD